MSETLIRRLKNLRYSLFYKLLPRKRVELRRLGNIGGGCSWPIFTEGFDRQLIVYSGGVGNEISFELDLLKMCECPITLCDPSPTGIHTMSLPENQSPHIQFLPVALAGKCGNLTFSKPLNPEEGSWFASSDSKDTVQVPCMDLPALMKKNNHDHIDLLKIDIEGSEYEVIDQILELKLNVRQIAVEYHHGMIPGMDRGLTVRSILNLVKSGYKLIAHEGGNHTFLKA